MNWHNVGQRSDQRVYEFDHKFCTYDILLTCNNRLELYKLIVIFVFMWDIMCLFVWHTKSTETIKFSLRTCKSYFEER